MKEPQVNQKSRNETQCARVRTIKVQARLGKSGGLRPTTVTHRN